MSRYGKGEDLVAAKGRARHRTETFSDWRQVGAIKMPYRAIQEENGAKTLEVIVSEYRTNTGIRAEELSKYPQALQTPAGNR